MASNIQFKTLAQLAQMQLDYISANAPVVLSSPLGPFITAVCYATALVGMVLQRLIRLVLNAARLSTSTGEDVDTFVEDFGLARLPGAKATGSVRFARFVTAVSQIRIPVGVTVQTSDLPPIQFVVVGDPTDSLFNPLLDAYILNSGSIQIDVPVQAVQPGTNGNVIIGAVNRIGSTLAGIDSVANLAAFTNGSDAESDEGLKDRFALYIQSLAKATLTAVASAVSNVQAGLIFKIYENLDINGTTKPGNFVVLVDDGSGAPAQSLLNEITRAVNVSRPVAVLPDVKGPQSTKQVVAYILIAFDDELVPDVLSLRDVITSNVVSYVNGTSFLEAVKTSKLYRAIWDAISPGDVVSTIISSAGESTNTTLRVPTTQGMQIGQLVDVEDFSTASGALPKIISIEADQSITLSPPLLAAPPPGTVVMTFSLKRDQILNVNALEYGVRQGVYTTGAAGGGFTGAAKNDAVDPNIAGEQTTLYIPSTTGLVINDPIIVPGFQPDPATATPNATNMRPIIKHIYTNSRVVIQPPLGQLQADGTWIAIQPTALPGTGSIVTTGISVFRAAYAGESSLAPPGGNINTQVARASISQVMVIMTPTIA